MSNKEEQQMLLQLQPLLGALSAQANEDDEELYQIKVIPNDLLRCIADGTINKDNFIECIKWIGLHCPNNFDEIMMKVNVPIPEELVDEAKQEYPEINRGIQTTCHTDIGLLTCVNERIFKYHVFFNFDTLTTGICMHKNIKLLKLLFEGINEDRSKFYKILHVIIKHDYVEGYEMFENYKDPDKYGYAPFFDIFQSCETMVPFMNEAIYKYDAINVLKSMDDNSIFMYEKHSFRTFKKACLNKAIKCALYLYEPEYLTSPELEIKDIVDDTMIDLFKIIVNNDTLFQDPVLGPLLISHTIEKGDEECFKFIFIEKRVPFTAYNTKRLISKKYFNLYMVMWNYWTNNPFAERDEPDVKQLLHIGISSDDVDILNFLCRFYESNTLYEFMMKQCIKFNAPKCAELIINNCKMSDEKVIEFL